LFVNLLTFAGSVATAPPACIAAKRTISPGADNNGQYLAVFSKLRVPGDRGNP
jgi:hypothetical protein